MPRPNQPRRIASEHALARRVAHEREKRGWSYDGLASRMTQVGCSIQSSAIYKIEKSDPPRRITVDELVGFATVFSIPVEQLLMPPELAARHELTSLLVAWDESQVNAQRAAEEAADALAALKTYVSDNPESEEDLHVLVQAWVDHYFAGEAPPGEVALTMHRLTGSADWANEFKRANPDLYPEML